MKAVRMWTQITLNSCLMLIIQFQLWEAAWQWNCTLNSKTGNWYRQRWRWRNSFSSGKEISCSTALKLLGYVVQQQDTVFSEKLLFCEVSHHRNEKYKLSLW